MNLRHLPLRRKLMLVIGLAVGAALLLNLLLDLVGDLREDREAIEAHAVGLAQVVGASTIAAIVENGICPFLFLAFP